MSFDNGVDLEQFQSTFPRGERPIAMGWMESILRSFNPRSREGNDCNRGSQTDD